MSVSPRLWRRIRRDFGCEAERIADAVARASPSERVQAGIVLSASGDEKLLEQYLELSRLDQRDLLVAAGLEGRGWERRLDRELGRSRDHGSAASRPRPRRAFYRVFIVLVVAGSLIALIGLPLLVVDQYLDQTARTATTRGQVTNNEHTPWGRGPEFTCTYDYTVEGSSHTGTDGCREDVLPGRQVTVRYDPDDAGSSHVWTSNHGVGLAVGLGAWTVGVAVLVRHWLKAGRTRSR